jgi:hypothetical protein
MLCSPSPSPPPSLSLSINRSGRRSAHEGLRGRRPATHATSRPERCWPHPHSIYSFSLSNGGDVSYFLLPICFVSKQAHFFQAKNWMVRSIQWVKRTKNKIKTKTNKQTNKKTKHNGFKASAERLERFMGHETPTGALPPEWATVVHCANSLMVFGELAARSPKFPLQIFNSSFFKVIQRLF